MSLRYVLATLTLACSIGCTPNAHMQAGPAPDPGPGTGDLAFRLVWEGPADLDLHVVEPSGVEIWYLNRTATSGGALDIDCNASIETACPHPVENVFWPKGRAPVGAYRYRICLVNTHGQTEPIPFTVLILHGSNVVSREEAELTRRETCRGPRETTWTR